MRTGGRIGGIAHDRATWLVLLSIALGVFAPAACVIWFMAEAASNHGDASRQRLSEAWRGQLRLLRDRFDADWRARVAGLGVGGRSAADFRRAVTAGGVDAIVFFDAGGMPAYPTLVADAAGNDEPPDDGAWLTAQLLEGAGQHRTAASQYAAMAARDRDRSRAARAAQAQIRSLVRSGDSTEALRAIQRHFVDGRLAQGRDPQGRLIAADAQLLALHLRGPSDAAFQPAVRSLAALVDDYDGTEMPSTQRLFLMGELVALAPDAAVFPTLAAEQLAAEFLQADGMPPAGDALEPARLPDVWKLRVAGPAVALLRTATVTAVAHAILDAQSGAGVRFALVPPGGDGGSDAMAASPLLPGWQISLSLLDADRLEHAAGQRVTMYLWAGSVGVGALAIAGLLLWQAFERQLRLSRLKTDLVAAVSHELRTPLASMRAIVDLLLDEPDIDRDRVREYLQLMSGENARLSRLIEHFLTFSRVDRGGHRLVFRAVPPAAIVEAAAGSGRDRFPGLQVDVARGLPLLHADEHALATALLNLIENAYKYTGDDKRIALRVRQDGQCVAFEVEDNGIGIAWRDRKRVFRPFYQVDQRLARERGGCGLGLSIVDFIVRAHGGRVALRSEPGAGSCFRITLPFRSPAQDAAA